MVIKKCDNINIDKRYIIIKVLNIRIYIKIIYCLLHILRLYFVILFISCYTQLNLKKTASKSIRSETNNKVISSTKFIQRLIFFLVIFINYLTK